MRTIIETLAAGVPAVYNIAGSHLEILGASSPVSVSLQDPNGIEITNGSSENVAAGTYFNPRVGFARFVIRSEVEQEITIGVSYGESGTRRTSGSVTIENTSGAFSQTVETVTNASGQLRAVNMNRRYLLIQNKDPAGDIFIRLDGVAATVANGVKIEAGGSIELTGFVPTGAVMAIGSIASNENVVVVEG